MPIEPDKCNESQKEPVETPSNTQREFYSDLDGLSPIKCQKRAYGLNERL